MTATGGNYLSIAEAEREKNNTTTILWRSFGMLSSLGLPLSGVYNAEGGKKTALNGRMCEDTVSGCTQGITLKEAVFESGQLWMGESVSDWCNHSHRRGEDSSWE